MSVPVPPKHTTPDNLENFARRILNMLDKNPFAMERLICRILSNKKNLQVSSALAAKVVEWRYGKASQPISGDESHPLKVLVEHIGTQDKTPAKTD